MQYQQYPITGKTLKYLNVEDRTVSKNDIGETQKDILNYMNKTSYLIWVGPHWGAFGFYDDESDRVVCCDGEPFMSANDMSELIATDILEVYETFESFGQSIELYALSQSGCEMIDELFGGAVTE